MHILIIEDDRELCQALILQLAANSYTVDCCHTGTEALYCAMKDSYDLIVLDRMLPEIDGLSILRSLRRNNISAPVILTTALDAVSDRIDGLDAGADDYLVKPYDTEELLARIRALTRRPRSYQENDAALSYKDIALNADTRTLSCPVLRTGRSGPALQKRSPAHGVFSPKSRENTEPGADLHKSLGPGRRSGGRQPGYLYLFLPQTSEKSEKPCTDLNCTRHRIPNGVITCFHSFEKN